MSYNQYREGKYMPSSNMQLSIRVKPEDYLIIKANAVKAGLSVSAWLIQQGKSKASK